MRRLLSTIILFVFLGSFPAWSAVVRGTVSDSFGNGVSYASVFVKDRSYGVSCDAEGTYFLELPAGNHTIVFSAMGYEKLEKKINLSPSQNLVLDVKLRENAMSLGETVISKVYVDRGKEIMRQVRRKGEEYNRAVENYSCNTYQKISIEKINTKPDSTDAETDIKPARKKKRRREKKDEYQSKDSLGVYDSVFVKKNAKDKEEKKQPASERGYAEKRKLDNMKLIESVEETHFKRPNKYKVVVNAYHDFSDVKTISAGGEIYLGFDYGERDISAVSFEYQDPYLISFRPIETDFNFYRNLIDAPNLCEKPLISPLGATAELNYRFSLDTSFYDEEKLIYRIMVKPVFKGEPLFSGTLYIEDSTWIIQSVNFAINPAALLFCQEFRINQDYAEVEKGIYLPVRREFTYTIKDGKTLRKGNTRVDHSNYKVNKNFHPKFFNNEVKSYDVEAFDRDTTWWDKRRSITLKTNELNYIQKSDSVRQYLESEAYLDSVDAEYNQLDVWNFLLTGIGHRNRFHGTEYYIAPLIAQLNPFGIGGYRHMLSGSFNKEFKNDYLLETNGQIDYGFRNKDVKGKIGAGLTYYPKKFVRTYVEVGDFYDVINTYPSIGTLLSRANFVRSKTVSIAQRMEIINGLFGELTFDYAGLDPLTNLQHDKWTQVLYGDMNEPTDFTSYKKSEIRIEFRYLPAQKYIIKRNKKIILGSKYPEFSFLYRKGLKGIFNSEVNFDYIEGGVRQDLQLGQFGYGTWSVLGGAFVNKENLRVIEHKYFRGSDKWIFSSPTASFQLLGPILSASESYLRMNGIIHDQGYIFNKIPIINKWRLGLAGGGAYLAIPEQDNFRHVEIFGGLEWIFRVRKQRFRLGAYAVTAENTISLPNLTWKFGLSFYNDYRKTWDFMF